MKVLRYTDVEYRDISKGKANTCLANELTITENFGSRKIIRNNSL